MALLLYFKVLGAGCPAAHAGSNPLLCLMEAAGKAGRMKDSEVTQTALHFALGGYLSTEFLIGTGFHNLLSHAGAAMARLRARPAGLANAIEEMKRYDVPFQMADRYAAEERKLGGCTIPAGHKVTVVYGSANRDSRVFGADADQFVIDRKIPPGKNYVFGHGIHYCIGAPMVGAVAPVLFDKLIQAMPGLQLAPTPPVRLTDPYYRAFSRLELTR
jgi:cytochrome P450